jgi:hypothetical protein
VGGQYLLVQPEANPVLYVTRSETEDNKPHGGDDHEGGFDIVGFITNLIPSGLGNWTSVVNRPDEKPTEKPSDIDNSEKVSSSRPRCCLHGTDHL